MASLPPHIYVGTAGWDYKDWEGIVYPVQIKKSQHPVEYMARYFDMLEINTSFYGHIKPEWGKLWCRKARLMLLQFPVSFKNTDRNRDFLGSLLEKFCQYPLAVEVRHNSWTNEGTLRYFTQKGVAFRNIDQPILGKAVVPSTQVTSYVGYVRLHGRNYEQWFDSDSKNDRYNYLYTQPELEKWKDRIEVIAGKAQKTFVVANNHFEGKAAVNALQLKSMLRGDTVSVPPSLRNRYWELSEIATSE